MSLYLSALYIYPVKSLRGMAVPALEVDELGLVGDRRYMVVDANSSQFLSQRALPRMALVTAALTPSFLELRSDSGSSVNVPRELSAGTPRLVSVWKDVVVATDCGDAPAEFLSDTLGHPCRLVTAGPQFVRPVRMNQSNLGRSEYRVGFADAYPVLVLSEASLSQLNDRLVSRQEDPVPMDRFRPNLVVSGCAPFEEDTWKRYVVGQVPFRHAGPCARCSITTTDQQTGERGREPLATLAQFRRDATDSTQVNFGQNAVIESVHGTLTVGDSITVLP